MLLSYSLYAGILDVLTIKYFKCSSCCLVFFVVLLFYLFIYFRIITYYGIADNYIISIYNFRDIIKHIIL